MSMEQHGATNSSQEIVTKQDKDINHHKRVDSSPTASCDDQLQKSASGKDSGDGDIKLSPAKSEHNYKDSSIKKPVIMDSMVDKPQVDHNLGASVSKKRKQGEELESTKSEMGEVMEENQRLKQYLNQIMEDYQILQRKFHEFAQQPPKQLEHMNKDEAELVSLSLGRSSCLDSKKSINNKVSTTSKEIDEQASNSKNNEDEEERNGSLALALDCNFKASRPTNSSNVQQSLVTNSSPSNSSDEAKDSEIKMAKNNHLRSGEDELLQHPPVKKARVSVRARCDTPTMNDGCQWRKYGQKIAKGNPCPRAYYRCTVAPSCPVRKQVQRCAEDMSILITTYEGTHNHPLPISATAMASTTSAAAYMLTSGSSTSSNQGSQPSATTTTIPTGAKFHDGLGYNTLDNPNIKSFYPPNSSTFSLAPAHPTITLDLTSETSSSTNQGNTRLPLVFAPKYSSTNLTFNSLQNSNNNTLPVSWPNGIFSYGTQPYINKAQQVSPQSFESSKHAATSLDQDHTFNLQTLLQRSIHAYGNPPSEDPLLDTIAQATKVLTSDPSFQSILTAALSPFISGNNKC